MGRDELQAGELVGILMHALNLKKLIEALRDKKIDPGEVRDTVIAQAESLRDQLQEVGFDISADAAERFLGAIEANATCGDLERLIGDLTLRFQDEARRRRVLVVPTNKMEFYEPDEPAFGTQFGPDVARQFRKKGKFEIGEASNCLALARDTACVFHLMRAVEVAIEALRLCLQLPAPTKGQHKAWGQVLGTFQTEIGKRNTDRAWPRQWNDSKDQKFFEQIQMSLVAIKDRCRDDTMHVESTYNEAQARHLFALTKGLMQKIASRLDEDGQPPA